MTLVDTSVWIDHIARPDPRMIKLLADGEVVTHPLDIAEVALGSLRQRAERLSDLATLPSLSGVSSEVVVRAIDSWKLYSRGIGAVDAHLLCVVMRAESVILWTRDKRLRAVADELGVQCEYEGSRE